MEYLERNAKFSSIMVKISIDKLDGTIMKKISPTTGAGFLSWVPGWSVFWKNKNIFRPLQFRKKIFGSLKFSLKNFRPPPRKQRNVYSVYSPLKQVQFHLDPPIFKFGVSIYSDNVIWVDVQIYAENQTLDQVFDASKTPILGSVSQKNINSN